MDEEGTVVNRVFYLADTDAFYDPCCVIPDIGGPCNRYFVVKPRNEWAELFIRWVDDQHNLDVMDPLDIVDDEDENVGDSEEDSASED